MFSEYRVKVKTSSKLGSGTDSKVWINIYGTNGELGEKKLPTSGGDMETGE